MMECSSNRAEGMERGDGSSNDTVLFLSGESGLSTTIVDRDIREHYCHPTVIVLWECIKGGHLQDIIYTRQLNITSFSLHASKSDNYIFLRIIK